MPRPANAASRAESGELTRTCPVTCTDTVSPASTKCQFAWPGELASRRGGRDGVGACDGAGAGQFPAFGAGCGIGGSWHRLIARLSRRSTDCIGGAHPRALWVHVDRLVAAGGLYKSPASGG